MILMTVVILGCLITVVAGCQKKSPEPGPNEVWIIGWNYIPDTITVAVGTTVTWNNTTRDYHTVTSDTNLFNAGLGIGESFNFTFTAPGTYVYHDVSTDPQAPGTVIVQ